MIQSVAIVSVFKHHSILSGYKNVLRFSKPIRTFGIDYTKDPSSFFLAHYFFHEFIARIKTIGLKFDVLHILYGEDYFRFSRLLFPGKKLVVTFHQPPAILELELSKGNYNGRIAGFTHALMRGRLKKVDAAIVMTEEQKQIAKKFIDESKIHVIPLGVELNGLNKKFKDSGAQKKNSNQLITVGEWQRDWNLYLKTVEYAGEKFPQLKFILINKNITETLKQKIAAYPNLEYRKDVSNEELCSLYLESLAMFLPLKSAAGNNALNEGLALGCPVISNLKFPHLKNGEKFVFNFSSENEFAEQLGYLQNLDTQEQQRVSSECNNSVQEYSWEKVSDKLIEVYTSIVNK